MRRSPVPTIATTMALAARFLLQVLSDAAPGNTLEVRVPPYGAAQVVEGPRHTRGTPPNVVETGCRDLARAGDRLPALGRCDRGAPGLGIRITRGPRALPPARVGEDGTVSDPERSEVRIRRAPKLGIFLLLGAVVGALVTLILTSLFRPTRPSDSRRRSATSSSSALPPAPRWVRIVGLIIDRVSIARARTVTVEREVVEGDENVAPAE